MKAESVLTIIGAGTVCPGDLDIRKKPGDFVIAADAGYRTLVSYGRLPDLLVADFDSMPDPGFPGETIRLPVVKDDTDTAFAVKEGLMRGFRKFVILGGLGGARFSHSIANLELLRFIRDNGGNGVLKCGRTEVSLLSEGETRRFSGEEQGFVSLFAASEEAVVTIRGLQYEVEEIRLTPSFPLGTSNAFTGKEAEITVKSGALFVVLEREE